MVQKPELIAFSHYRLGGVQNFYYNLLSNLAVSGEFDILWIYEDSDDTANAKLAQTYGIGREIIFNSDLATDRIAYDRFRRLGDQVSDRPGIILTNFYLELQTLHIHRRKNKTIYFICHDETYLKAAADYEFLIDVFIAHNPQFYKDLKELFPLREKDIFYLPYGVTIRKGGHKEKKIDPLHIIFAARHVQHKGIFDLPEIINRVEEKCGAVKWTILGDGPFTPELKEIFKERKNISFKNFVRNEEVIDEMAEHDIFILPSYLDGLPVAMLEAMSVGCVPVIYQFNKGITEILGRDEGFIVPAGDKIKFAEAITKLYSDRDMLQSMSRNCITKVQKDYDIKNCVENYKTVFLRFKEFKRPVRRKFIAYGGFLEHPNVPGFIRNGLRKIKNLF